MPKGENLKKYQWVKGQSGNPLGRLKGVKNLSACLKEIIDVEIETEDPLTEETCAAPLRLFINNRLLRNALDGDHKALQEIYDRLEGKPKQKLDITADMKVRQVLLEAIKKARSG